MSAELTTNDTTGKFEVIFRRLLRNTSVCSSVMTAAGNQWQVQLCTGSKNASLQTTSVACYLANMSSHCVGASFRVELYDAKGHRLAMRSVSKVDHFSSSQLGKNMLEGENISVSDSQLKAITVCVTLSVCRLCGSRVDKSPAKLTGMLVSGCFSDFTIIARRSSNAEEPVRILVHKLVLSLRSAVIKTMIESGMSESAGCVLRITDFDAAVVQEFVRFMYAGKYDVTSHTEALLALVHRYEVPELQHLCQHHLLCNMTAYNVLPVLSLADLYSSAELRESVLTFIVNNAAALLKSRTFLPGLSLELCQDVLCAVVGVELSTALPAGEADPLLAAASEDG
jgi:hypothetical protein